MGRHAATQMNAPAGERKNMTIMLDENELILESLKKAMADNNLKECAINDMEGTLKQGIIKTTGKETKRINIKGKK